MIASVLVSLALAGGLAGSVVYAANSFPTGLNSWGPGDVIESDWADALEDKIGIDDSTVATSLDFYVKNASFHATSTLSVGTTATSTLSSTATSTFATGVDLSSGCFAINGDCLATGGAPFAWTPDADTGGVATSTLIQLEGGAITTGSTTHTGVLHADGTIDLQNLFTIDAEELAGVQRLRFQGNGVNDAMEIFLQAKGSANSSRLTITPDSSASNYSFITIESNGTSQIINSGNQGTESTLPLDLQIDGTSALTINTSGQTSLTGTLTFDGVTTDITTNTNENLILNPNGTGLLSFASTTPNAKYSFGTGALVMPATTLTDGATVTIDWSDGNIHKVTLGDNRTIAFSNVTPPQSVRVFVTQDATGSRTLSYPASVHFMGGEPTLSTKGGSTDILVFTAPTSTETIIGTSATAQ